MDLSPSLLKSFLTLSSLGVPFHPCPPHTLLFICNSIVPLCSAHSHFLAFSGLSRGEYLFPKNSPLGLSPVLFSHPFATSPSILLIHLLPYLFLFSFPTFLYILKLTSCSLVMNLSTSVQGVSSISLWGRNHANAEYVTGLEGTQLISTSWHIPICVTKRWPLVLPWQDCPEWFPQSPQCHLLPLSTPWQSFEVLLKSLFKFHTLRPKFQRTYIRLVACWFRFCFICNLESHYWRI